VGKQSIHSQAFFVFDASLTDARQVSLAYPIGNAMKPKHAGNAVKQVDEPVYFGLNTLTV